MLHVRMIEQFVASPQPFAVNELIIDDQSYPSDCLYADDKTFLANVLLGVRSFILGYKP